MEEVKLQDFDFPINLKICLRPGLNNTALQQRGYANFLTYVLGVSRFNNSLIGWGGHTRDSKALSSARNVLTAVSTDATDVIDIINVVTRNDELELVFRSNLDRINWLDECRVLDLRNLGNLEAKGTKGIYIYFNEAKLTQKNITVEVQLQGQTLATRRNINGHQFYHSGEVMSSLLGYIVKLKKNVFVEEDPSRSCRNYPNLDFESYTDCDDKYVKERFKSFFPGLNLTSPWLTDNLETVTMEPVDITGKQIPSKNHCGHFCVICSSSAQQISNLFYGDDQSDCPLPCTTISTETRLSYQQGEVIEGQRGILLSFDRTVEVRLDKKGDFDLVGPDSDAF